MRVVLSVLVIAAIGSGRSAARDCEQPVPTQDEAAARAFLADVQRLVARDDRSAVAALIRYPILIASGTVQIPVADAAALVERYDVVFSPALRDAPRGRRSLFRDAARQPTPRWLRVVHSLLRAAQSSQNASPAHFASLASRSRWASFPMQQVAKRMAAQLLPHARAGRPNGSPSAAARFCCASSTRRGARRSTHGRRKACDGGPDGSTPAPTTGLICRAALPAPIPLLVTSSSFL